MTAEKADIDCTQDAYIRCYQNANKNVTESDIT